MVENKENFLRIYAKAYFERNATLLEDFLAPIVYYSRQSIYPNIFEKNSFIKFLNGRFYEQYLTTDKFYGIIELVNDENNDLLLFLSSCNQETLFSIDIQNNLVYKIDAIKTDKISIKRKETLYNTKNKLIENIKYTNTGYIILDKHNDLNEVINIIIQTKYRREYCVVFSFDHLFIADLMHAGFIVMMTKIDENEYAIKATHHTIRSVLKFENLHISKTAKRYIQRYELKFDCDFEFIINRCYEKYGDNWLTRPLIESINYIRNNNIGSIKPVSFGVYRNGELKAGEFGIISGKNYTSYSGYHDENNAGKVQMLLTTQYLKDNGFSFYDLGMPLKYKKELGAENVDFKSFIELFRSSIKYDNSSNKKLINIDDQSLEFYDYEDFPVAYDSQNHVTYDVMFKNILKQRNEYPSSDDIFKNRHLLYGRRISKQEALKMATEIEELNLISNETLLTMIPSIDHSRLRFVEVEDVPMAYFPKRYISQWRVFHPGILKLWKGWPNWADMGYGSRITKEEALKLAEESEISSSKNKI